MKEHQIAVVVCCLLAAGCVGGPASNQQATINLDYASTSLGYRNSGALSSGQLFLWDLAENRLVSLDPAIPVIEQSRTTPVNLQAKNVSGIGVSLGAGLPAVAKATVESEVSRQVSFTVADAVRVNNAQAYSAISQGYSALGASGVDAYRAWRIADATTHPERYKFVLLIDPVLASSEEMTINNQSSSGATLDIVNKLTGNFTVKIPENATARCSGTAVTCYVNAKVLTVFINDAGRLDYEPAAFDRVALSEALRN